MTSSLDPSSMLYSGLQSMLFSLMVKLMGWGDEKKRYNLVRQYRVMFYWRTQEKSDT